MAEEYLTADIMDAYETAPDIQILPNCHPWRDYGGAKRWKGKIATVKCLENNPLIRQRLMNEDGSGRVLVIDGGSSLACALIGGTLAKNGAANGWQGVLINGAVRDTAELESLAIGCRALGSNPRKSAKHSPGEMDVAVTFANVTFEPGYHLYADEDGIIVSKLPLVMPKIDSSL